MQMQTPIPAAEKKPEKSQEETQHELFSRLALAGCKRGELELLRKCGIVEYSRGRHSVRKEFVDAILRPKDDFIVAGLGSKAADELSKLLIAMRDKILPFKIKVIKMSESTFISVGIERTVRPTIYFKRSVVSDYPSGELSHTISIRGGERQD